MNFNVELEVINRVLMALDRNLAVIRVYGTKEQFLQQQEALDLLWSVISESYGHSDAKCKE